MNLKYSLDENDFITYSLFTASQSKRTNFQRKRTLILLSVAFIMLAISFYGKDNFSFYFFLVFAVSTLIFYPFYQRSQYKNHYKKYVRENYKARFGQISTLDFKVDSVETISLVGEAKINYSVSDEIINIKDYVFINLKTGGGIIIPKNEIPNVELFFNLMEKIKEDYKLKKYENLNWKWK